jgi:hypothetical protein
MSTLNKELALNALFSLEFNISVFNIISNNKGFLAAYNINLDY